MTVYTRPKMEVRLDYLADNYRVLKKLSGSAIAAGVVKNNAYGLGDIPVAKRLIREGCTSFFVAHATEGVRIRTIAPQADIYVLQGVGHDNIADIVQSHLIPVIATPAQLQLWQSQGISNIKPMLQVETGLNRLGFKEEQLKTLTQKEKESFSFVLSHLACADNPAHFMNDMQLKQLKKCHAYLPNIPLTLSASDGVFLGAEFRFDMVRLGAAMYGLNTAPYRPNQMKSVLFVSAPVLQISNLMPDQYIGYGATYQVTRPMRVAVVSIGYGDGLPRSLSSVGQIRFQGISCPIIGRISMDNIMCDVTQVPELKEGDFVSILDDVYTADEMGRQAGTIGYEILSNLGKGQRFCVGYVE